MYLSDKPITSSNEDILDRKTFAEQIATVEQSVVASEQLSGQANMLNEELAKFRLAE